MRPLVSVILIREVAEQLTGSGCCGKLHGDNALWGGGKLFERTRRELRDLGVLHRAIREFYPAKEGVERVSVVSVDPRNQLYLVPKLWSDVVAYQPGWRAGLRTVLQLFSLPAVVVNGRVISRRDRLPDPDALCHHIHDLIELQRVRNAESTRP